MPDTSHKFTTKRDYSSPELDGLMTWDQYINNPTPLRPSGLAQLTRKLRSLLLLGAIAARSVCCVSGLHN